MVCLQPLTSNYVTINISAPLLKMIPKFLTALQASVDFSETQEDINRLLQENMRHNKRPENVQDLANQLEIETLFHQNRVQDLRFECGRRHYIGMQEGKRLNIDWQLNDIRREAEYQKELQILEQKQRIENEATTQALPLIQPRYER